MNKWLPIVQVAASFLPLWKEILWNVVDAKRLYLSGVTSADSEHAVYPWRGDHVDFAYILEFIGVKEADYLGRFSKRRHRHFVDSRAFDWLQWKPIETTDTFGVNMLKKTNQRHFDSVINLYISKIWLDFVKMFNIFSSKIIWLTTWFISHELGPMFMSPTSGQAFFKNKLTNRRSRYHWNGHPNISWKSGWSKCWWKGSSIWCYISTVVENIIDEKYGKVKRHEWRIQRVSL